MDGSEHPRRPIPLAIVSRQEVVTRGLTAMLSDYPERVMVTALASNFAPQRGVRVILYDTYCLHRASGEDLQHLLHHSGANVLVYARDMRPDLRARALAMGAHAWVSMSAGPRELIEAIELVAVGQPVPERHLGIRDAAGLTTREEEVVALIAQGLSNQEIADKLVLSLNTLKSHIRNAYAKMGVRSRAQAVSWAIQHGFAVQD
jgi:DNA-binding NarL/FixJ family response regulator